MTTPDWIALVTEIITALGGGAMVVAKLTRIAVAAEVLAEKIQGIVKQLDGVQTQVLTHENRLNKGGLLQVDVGQPESPKVRAPDFW